MAVIASKQGIQQIVDKHPDVSITIGTIDELTEDGQIMPGLGDSGDRLFSAPGAEDEEALMHPSRRKRSLSQSST
jgi:uracil phosphoribosyltransferase